MKKSTELSEETFTFSQTQQLLNLYPLRSQAGVTEITYWGKNALILGEQGWKNYDFFQGRQ